MRKVLIIDLEPAIAGFLASVLESELGFAPVVACSVETALESLNSFDYDLIISDALSFHPQLNAKEGGDRWRWLAYLRRQLNATNANTPLLAMSSHSRQYYADYAHFGYSGYVAKPFHLNELMQEILRVLSAFPYMGQTEAFQLNGLSARKAAASLPADFSRLSQLTV